MNVDDQKLISVIIPIYNREGYIRKCVDSVLGQKGVCLEIILVDDGSTDKSPQICDEYAKRYDNIRVIHKQNAGLSSARNVGLDMAKGDYIVFVDDDDFLPDESLSVLLTLLENNSADVAIGNYAEYTNEHLYKGAFSIPEKFCNRILGNREACELLLYSDRTHILMVSWGKIFRKEIWEGLRFDESKSYAEDQFIFPELIGRCHTIFLTDSIVYNQVFTTKSLARGDVNRRHLFHSEGVARVIDYLIKQGYYDIALFKFGLGSRHLIFMKKKLNDEDSKQEIKRQYCQYKKLARKLFFHVNLKNKLRFILFLTNLDLYRKVREAL